MALLIIVAVLAVANLICAPLVYGYALAQHRVRYPLLTEDEPGSDVRYAMFMAGLALLGGPVVLLLQLLQGGWSRGPQFR